jgi:glycerol-3-phosphate dehydrogenase subunit B
MVGTARRDSSPISAVLLGSWLGMTHERATELSSRVGVPVGEVLVGVGSSAGLRFELAVRKFLDRLSVKFVSDRVATIRRSGERIEVVLETDASVVVADAIVIATGGVVAGSIVYSPPDLQAGEHMPPQIDPTFSFAIQTPGMPIVLGWGSGRIDTGSSVFGPPLDTTAWPLGARPSTLESVGIEAPHGKVCSGIYAAGDVVAGKRRTMLDAVTAGLRAGRMV